jgi:hypothetical protein
MLRILRQPSVRDRTEKIATFGAGALSCSQPRDDSASARTVGVHSAGSWRLCFVQQIAGAQECGRDDRTICDGDDTRVKARMSLRRLNCGRWEERERAGVHTGPHVPGSVAAVPFVVSEAGGRDRVALR